ncbi:MAG: hypothetical protein ACK5Q5_12235 [Planctomycetaceae bacterium]
MTDFSPNSSSDVADAAGMPLAGLVLSLGFWGCLIAAGALFGAVSLAAKVVCREDLVRDHAHRQGELLTLQREVQHLQQVANELRSDSRLAASVARQAWPFEPNHLVSIPLTGELQHDPRQLPPDPIDVVYEEPIYLPLLQSLADSPRRRWRWSFLAAGLLVFGFVFLHENAGSRALGRALIAPGVWLGRRYSARSDADSAG